jgi:hypothetical protein
MGEQERPAYKLRGSDFKLWTGARRYLERNREAWMAGDKRVKRREALLEYYNGFVMIMGAAALAKGLELLLNQ